MKPDVAFLMYPGLPCDDTYGTVGGKGLDFDFVPCHRYLPEVPHLHEIPCHTMLITRPYADSIVTVKVRLCTLWGLEA
jgi:hypothetical protein